MDYRADGKKFKDSREAKKFGRELRRASATV
jgi:hypothetical protein